MDLSFWLACAALAVAMAAVVRVELMDRRAVAAIRELQQSLNVLSEPEPAPLDESWRNDTLSGSPPPPPAKKRG
jgi:hypothetical protein